MGKNLFTSHGAAIEIGRELGRGGEGSVFEVPLLGSQVAKLYHKEPSAKKQAKLAFMASTADQQLLSYLAWPQETLHPARGGPVVGFLMPKVIGKEPIHMVYSPAHRRQDHPKAAWDFLLFVARNIAACFETVHKHGHVIGDVNQNSIMVGKDSKVVLIDSDSFQVNARGTMHLCEVGVSHFTPPELQSLPSFDGFTRTNNHDNFGLALLIFHVLFGGRHPYSGIPLKSGVGDALEDDIKNFRYAYARDNKSRGIGPPPRAIPLSIVPDAMEQMFYGAFTEGGAQSARPTAPQWVAALDGVRGRLKKCSRSTMHIYPDHLKQCPWCALDQQGVAYFIDLGTTSRATSSGFVLNQIWATIEAVPYPSLPSIPTPSDFTAIPRPLPSLARAKLITAVLRAVAVVACLLYAVFGEEPGASILAFGAVVVGWFAAGLSVSAKHKSEKAKRETTQKSAMGEYDGLVERVKREAGLDRFRSKKASLKALKDGYLGLAQEEQEELNKMASGASERQKQKFLEGCFIDRASISGVGPSRKAALRSFGIETAADVSRGKVMQVRGFGEGLTRAVLDWRASCERRFVYNASNAVTAADRATVRANLNAKRTSIEAALLRGAAELRAFPQQAIDKVTSLRPQLEEAAMKLAQAEADLSILRRP